MKKVLPYIVMSSLFTISVHAWAANQQTEDLSTKSISNKTTPLLSLDKKMIQKQPQGEQSYGAIVLTYHGISDIKNNMNTSLKTFEEQMSYLHENGYNIIKGSDLIKAINNKSLLPPKSVVLTFDDGWKNQDQAMEILDKYKFPATFGLVSIFQKQNSPTGLQKSDFIKYQTDNFDYVNHSFTHRQSDYLGNPTKDLDKSEAVLKQIFGKLSPYYIYPYGLKNAKLVTELKNRGYLGAYGVLGVPVDTRHSNVYNIPRYLINDKVSLDKFKTILEENRS